MKFAINNYTTMPIQQVTPQSAIDAYLRDRLEAMKRATLRTLCYAGEKAVNIARAKHNNDWTDQTGNLRSSIGYVVADNGTIVARSDFQQIGQGSEGVSGGQTYVRELVNANSEGAVLIVVAGMEYAKYVSARGYDVLDSSEIEAEQVVERLLKQLKF